MAECLSASENKDSRARLFSGMDLLVRDAIHWLETCLRVFSAIIRDKSLNVLGK